jgi:autophagy-related protein 9
LIWHKIFLVSVAAVYVFQLASFASSIPRLLEMYRFYTHLLGIPDVSNCSHLRPTADDKGDIQTLPWPEIVRMIGEIRKHNPVTSLSNGRPLAQMVGEDAGGPIKKLDAHDIAKWAILHALTISFSLSS